MNNIINQYKVHEITIINSKKTTFINKVVDKIFVINLKNNILRKKYIHVLMKKYKINFTLVIVEKLTNKVYQELNNRNDKLTLEESGCLISHLWCLNKIIKNKYKNAIIFEDDIVFHKQFHKLFQEIYNEKYDFLVLGACDFSFSKINRNNVMNNLYVPHKTAANVYGAHANYYSLKGAQTMFHLKINNPSFFDSDYQGMFQHLKGTAFICYPNLVVSDISTTNLSHNYPFCSIYEKNYYDKCFDNFNFQLYNFIYLDIIQKNKDIPILESDSLETYMVKIIYYTFYNTEKETIIKNRLSFDFFSIHDIKYMIHVS